MGNKTIIEAEDSMAAAIAYVAMTRATHLTCLGVHINTVSGYLPQLCAMGMKIRACAPDWETIIQDILDVKEA